MSRAELRRSLYALFATYGEVIDIVTKKEERMREQAFVVYNDVASATAALRSLNGFIFYDKNLVGCRRSECISSNDLISYI